MLYILPLNRKRKEKKKMLKIIKIKLHLCIRNLRTIYWVIKPLKENDIKERQKEKYFYSEFFFAKILFVNFFFRNEFSWPVMWNDLIIIWFFLCFWLVHFFFFLKKYFFLFAKCLFKGKLICFTNGFTGLRLAVCAHVGSIIVTNTLFKTKKKL